MDRKYKKPVMRRVFLNALFSIGLCVLLQIATSDANACGVNSHLWITDSAICQLPVGSKIRGLFEDQRRVDLTRLGSSFPDSGYAIDHEYGEVAHWPPFVQAFVESFQSRHGTDETQWTAEAFDEVAFIMGVAAHGYEDELFDTQFLRWVEQEDGAGQNIIDPAIDLLLIHEGHTELLPELYFPVEATVDALRRTGVAVEVSDVESGLGRVHQFALGLTRASDALASLVERDAPLIPWATRHYLNREVTGSLAHEPLKVAALLEAIYERLAHRPVSETVLSHIEPMAPHALDRTSIERRDESRWISLYFHTAVQTEAVLHSLRLLGETGSELSYEARSTRWGGGGYTRIIQLSPYQLNDESTITVEIGGGIPLFNGEITSETIRYTIEICDDDDCRLDPSPSPQLGGRQRGCFVAETILESPDDSVIEERIEDLGIELSAPFDQGESHDQAHDNVNESDASSELEDLTPNSIEEEPVSREQAGCAMSALSSRTGMSSRGITLPVLLLILLALLRNCQHLAKANFPPVLSRVLIRV